MTVLVLWREGDPAQLYLMARRAGVRRRQSLWFQRTKRVADSVSMIELGGR
jgi:hypothetical protein